MSSGKQQIIIAFDSYFHYYFLNEEKVWLNMYAVVVVGSKP